MPFRKLQWNHYNPPYIRWLGSLPIINKLLLCMSLKAIPTDDYTSTELLQELIQSAKNISLSNKSSPSASSKSINIPDNATAIIGPKVIALNYQTLKPTKAHSLHPTEKQMNSFKLLYDFITAHSLTKQKAVALWQKFSICNEDLVKVEALIWEFQEEYAKDKKNIEVQVNTDKSQAIEKQTNNKINRSKSWQKLIEKDKTHSEAARSSSIQNLKNAMKKQMRCIRRVIEHGQKFILS